MVSFCSFTTTRHAYYAMPRCLGPSHPDTQMHGVCLSAVCPLSVRTARGAALAGWWVCNNKKDDLVMMHALARFEEQLGELDQAEERLHAALETMLAADTDMHTLTAAITTATGEAKAQLAAIREHNERAARGTRRRVLDNVLVDLADDDGSLTMGPVQRRKLLWLIAHMAGRGADELPAFYAALGLKYAAQAAAHADALPSGGMISEPSWQRGYGDADFVVHEAALPGDDPREFPTKEILDQLEELGAFEIIMGLQAPGEGGGGGIDGGGGSEQEEEHAQHARPEGAWEARSGRRDVKRGGAKGSSHLRSALGSEVLPLAVAEPEEDQARGREFGVGGVAVILLLYISISNHSAYFRGSYGYGVRPAQICPTAAPLQQPRPKMPKYDDVRHTPVFSGAHDILVNVANPRQHLQILQSSVPSRAVIRRACPALRCCRGKRAGGAQAPVWKQCHSLIVNVSANWPRLTEVGGRPELDLALAGRAGGRIGRSLCAAALRIGGHGEGESRRLGGGCAARCATGDEAILLAVVGKCETHVEGDLLRHGTLIITP